MASHSSTSAFVSGNLTVPVAGNFDTPGFGGLTLDMSCLQSSTASAPPSAPPCSPNPCGQGQRLGALPWKRLQGSSGQEGGLPARVQRWEEDWERRGVRTVLTGQSPMEPILTEFVDKAETKYSVKIFHAPQYHMMRHWLCGDDLNFARSIYRCKRITPQGGKTRAAFFVSHDRRYLVKQLNKAELKMLMTREQQDAMMWYADRVLFEKLPSVLAQVVGLFTVTVASRNKSKTNKRSFVVQRNLRFSLHSRAQYVFDLKGTNRKVDQPQVPSGHASLRGAAAAQNSDNEEDEPESPSHGGEAGHRGRAEEGSQPRKLVLWDANFREWTEGKPLCLVAKDLQYLEAAVWNDTLLLSTQKLVDYSLLLTAVVPDGDEQCNPASPPGMLSIGIIDYLRTYDLAKMAESHWKQLKGGPDKPTVISPPEYANRFRSAMGTFFVAEMLS